MKRGFADSEVLVVVTLVGMVIAFLIPFVQMCLRNLGK